MSWTCPEQFQGISGNRRKSFKACVKPFKTQLQGESRKHWNVGTVQEQIGNNIGRYGMMDVGTIYSIVWKNNSGLFTDFSDLDCLLDGLFEDLGGIVGADVWRIFVDVLECRFCTCLGDYC